MLLKITFGRFVMRALTENAELPSSGIIVVAGRNKFLVKDADFILL